MDVGRPGIRTRGHWAIKPNERWFVMLKGIQMVALFVNTLFAFFFLASCHGGNIPDFRVFLIFAFLNAGAAFASWKQGVEVRETYNRMEIEEDECWWENIETDIKNFYFNEDCQERAFRMQQRDGVRAEHAKLMEVLYERLVVVRNNQMQAKKYAEMKAQGKSFYLGKPMAWPSKI